MKACANRIYGKRDACKELAEIFEIIASEGETIDSVIVGAVLQQYRQDKLDVLNRNEDALACSLGDNEYKAACQSLMDDDNGTVDRLHDYFIPKDRNLGKSLRSIVYEMLQKTPGK